jgi:hypothetical protein
MNADELQAAIAADPKLKELASSGSDAVIAKLLTEAQPPVAVKGSFIGERGVLDVLGLEAGEKFLQALEALADGGNKSMQRVVRWLRDTIGIDIGHPAVQLQLLSLVEAGVISKDSAEALITRGSSQPVITPDMVSAALTPLRPDGKVA